MNKIVLVIGGCRSGKSDYALNEANKESEKSKLFIATCVPTDDEMKERVDKHQKDRDSTWATLETPLLIHKEIDKNSKDRDIIIVDCLTLWTTNLIMKRDNIDEIKADIKSLVLSLDKAKKDCTVYLVTNEVGLGIVPENKLARYFRDVAGLVNQEIAKCADEVVMSVAGIPVKIKEM